MQQAGANARKDEVTARFNATASGYDANRAIRACGQRLLELVALQPGERVLDVACGTGNLSLPAAQGVGPTGRVVGVDLTPGMLEEAKSKARGLGLSNIDLRVGDAERLDLEDASFDVVLCGLGIMFVPDPQAAATEWLRVLRPGGRVAFSTWRYGFGTPALRQLLNARLATLGINGTSIADQATQDSEACRTLLQDAGFVDTDVVTEQHGFFFSNPDEYWLEDVTGSITGALLAKLEPSDVARLKADHFTEVAASATPQGIWREGAVNLARGRKPS